MFFISIYLLFYLISIISSWNYFSLTWGNFFDLIIKNTYRETMKNCSIFIKDKDIILMSSHRMRDTSVSHICHERYLNSRLAGFVERSRRRAQSRRIPDVSRYERIAKKLLSFLFRTSPTAVRGDVRTDRSRGTNSRARWRARASLLSSPSLRDQFVEVEERYGEG